MKTVIGIDPGFTGAICCIVDGEVMCIEDMPTAVSTNGKTQMLPAVLAQRLKEMGPDLLVLEEVTAMPGNGGVSMFRFGQGHGICMGIASALEIPLHRIRPQEWKKAFGLVGSDKDQARIQAIEQCPSIASLLARKKDSGRADAYWLARYGQRFLNQD